MQMKNALTLSAEDVAAKIQNGEPYVIRLKVPLKEEIRFKDIVRDWVVVHSSTIDDKILMKSDGMPTYHLANIVDDHLMEITHVIRGEEWLPSAPLHVLLYKAFGWTPPEFAHLPLLLKPEGNGKLSKRDGVLGDFPVFPLEWKDKTTGDISRGFREDGYYADAVVNFLAFLGWNPGTEQEIMTLDELIAAFDINHIHKSGARFDVNKAKWYNQMYLRQKDDTLLMGELNATLNDSSLSEKIVKLMKERVTFTKEMIAEVPYLFDDIKAYDEEISQKKWDDLAKTAMPVVAKILEGVADFNSIAIHDALFAGLEAEGIKPGKIMQALRLALTGEGKGPDLMLTIEILGKEKSISRINRALEVL
jgi:glutamyl-tRNA synthetase